jgi:predicted nucleic acid-binding protein
MRCARYSTLSQKMVRWSRLFGGSKSNSLTVAVQRGRIDEAFRNAALADLALLGIETDPDTDAYGWTTTVHLADRFRLTVYDAAYLELAHRRSLPLASLDAELRAAGGTLGVPLLGFAT